MVEYVELKKDKESEIITKHDKFVKFFIFHNTLIILYVFVVLFTETKNEGNYVALVLLLHCIILYLFILRHKIAMNKYKKISRIVEHIEEKGKIYK